MTSVIPDGWVPAYPRTMPRCRSLSQPYDAGLSGTFIEMTAVALFAFNMMMTLRTGPALPALEPRTAP